MVLNLRRLLGNRNLIFLMALVLGFLWDTGSEIYPTINTAWSRCCHDPLQHGHKW